MTAKNTKRNLLVLYKLTKDEKEFLQKKYTISDDSYLHPNSENVVAIHQSNISCGVESHQYSSEKQYTDYDVNIVTASDKEDIPCTSFSYVSQIHAKENIPSVKMDSFDVPSTIKNQRKTTKTNHKILLAVIITAAVLLCLTAVVVLLQPDLLFHPSTTDPTESSLKTDTVITESSLGTDTEIIESSPNAVKVIVKEDFFALPYNGIAVITNDKKVDITYVEEIDWEKVDGAKKWSNIKSLSTGYKNLFGLCNDGTVKASGNNEYGQCNVDDWKDVVLIDGGYEHTIALRSDGTVYAVGNNTDGRCDVQDWEHLIFLSAGRSNTVGLKDDGTVLVTGGNEWQQSEITDWRDIKMISAGYYHTIGLRSDGTVIAQGSNKYGQCDVDDWKDIIAVCAGKMHTVALKKDGTVVATGHNDYGQCNVSDWKDVVELYVEKNYTVGKTTSGDLLITGLCFYDDDISERKYYLNDYKERLT